MGLGYGSNIALSGLRAGEVGSLYEEISSSSSSFPFSFVSILLTIVEVGIAFTGIGAVAEAGVGLAAGIANQAIDVASGQTSIANSILNLATPFAGGAFSGLKNISSAKQLVTTASKNFEKYGEDIKKITDLIKAGEYGSQKELEELGKSILNLKGKQAASAFLEKSGTDIGSFSKLNKGAGGIKSKLLKAVETAEEKADKIDIFKDVIGEVKDFKWTGRTLRLSDNIVREGNEDVERFLKRAGASAKEIEEILKLAERNPFFLKKAIARIIKGSTLAEKDFLRLIAANETKISKYISLSQKNYLKAAKSKFISQTSRFLNIAMSPSALASEVVSKTAAKLSARLEEYGTKIGLIIKKVIKGGVKTAKMIEDEFVKTGGKLVKSKWIMGYKVLQETPATASIMIQFRIEGTKSNQGINMKGKQPVFVTLSLKQIESFLASTSKGNWYINNIAKSRGGRHASELELGDQLENWLGLLPVAEINEIVGFASLGKTFEQNIANRTGTFIWSGDTYFKAATGALVSGLIAEGVKGGVALTGTSNQYVKQFLEGAINGVTTGTTATTSLSNSFQSTFSSATDAAFEDRTRTGKAVKNIKVAQSGITGIKGITG